MAKLRAFSVPPRHAAAALARTHAAGDAALFFDPALPATLYATLCATFGPSSLTVVATDGSSRTTAFDDGVTLADDTALVVLTSGSTGTPKGVELSHQALAAAVSASLTHLGFTTAHTLVQALPTHHIAGLLVGLRAEALGATVLAVDTPDQLSRVTSDLTALVPTQLARLVAANADLSQLGTILLGGSGVDPDIERLARLNGATIVTSYGMSETCGGCVYDGVPLADVAVEVDAPKAAAGRILLRGAQLFSGYRIGRTLTAHDKDDWFVTSDQGVWQNGRLIVIGRIDSTVVSGGENVPLAAVADALRTTPGVTDVLVLGRTDATWGEEVVAVIVSDTPLETISTHLRDVLPPYFVPRKMRRVTAIPQTSLGKPDHAAALALFADDA